jgi:acyl carrier protein
VDRSDIEAAVITILAKQLLLPAEAIAADATVEELGLDSLGKVEAIFALEERFDIHVPFNANEPDRPDFDFSSVPSIVLGVERLIAQRSA